MESIEYNACTQVELCLLTSGIQLSRPIASLVLSYAGIKSYIRNIIFDSRFGHKLFVFKINMMIDLQLTRNQRN